MPPRPMGRVHPGTLLLGCPTRGVLASQLIDPSTFRAETKASETSLPADDQLMPSPGLKLLQVTHPPRGTTCNHHMPKPGFDDCGSRIPPREDLLRATVLSLPKHCQVT